MRKQGGELQEALRLKSKERLRANRN
jgi:hypothetical protein